MFVFSNSQTTRRCKSPTLRARSLTELALIPKRGARYDSARLMIKPQKGMRHATEVDQNKQSPTTKTKKRNDELYLQLEKIVPHISWPQLALEQLCFIPYKNFSILFVFHTYFNPILILSRSILLLFSLIRKIDHLFYCCFASIETLFYKQWSILSLFLYTKPQNSP